MKRKLERSLQVFDRVRPLCEDLGIALAVENCHRFGVEVLSYYFERYPPEFVGLCFDSGHANLHGDTEELMRLDGRLNALHLHDNRGKEDDHQPPFWGTIDWGHVMRWIGRVAYSKPINFEIVHRAGLFGGTPEEFMEFTVRSVRRTLALMEQ